MVGSNTNLNINNLDIDLNSNSELNKNNTHVNFDITCVAIYWAFSKWQDFSIQLT